MKRYRQRNAAQASLVGAESEHSLDLTTLFGRQAPLRLEIGFGHGEFLSQMAASHPDENFIGVEHQDLRVTKTAHKSLGLGATNVRLFWDDAQHFVRHRLPPGCLNRSYILFSDPWPKRKHRRRRLMNRGFLLDLAHAMGPGGQLTIATDATDYGLQVLSHISTLPGLWRNRYGASGYAFNIYTKYPTVFERYKKSEGHDIIYLQLERTQQAAGARAPWSGLPGSSPRRGQNINNA